MSSMHTRDAAST